MDWKNPKVNESTEERETEMSGLVVGFSMRMRKQVANAQGETFSSLKVLDDKCSKRSRLDEEVQADHAVITVDFPERLFEALSVVGGASQSKDETPARELPHVDEASIEASLSEAIDVPSPQARQVSLAVLCVWRALDRLVLSLYVEPMEWARPKEDMLAPNQETSRELINDWRPFN